MLIYRPIKNLPLWFYENLDFPTINYDTLNWTSTRGDKLLEDGVYDRRQRASSVNNSEHPQMKILREIMNDVLTEIERTCDFEDLKVFWPFNTWHREKEFMFDVKRDEPGFSMGPHLDNRNIKWTMIANLEDNVDSTTFHVPGVSPLSGPKKKGSGIFFFNHHDLLHSIDITELRYIVFYMSVVQ